MPNDEPPIEHDGTGFEEQPSGQPAMVDEAPNDTGGSTSPPEAESAAPTDGEVRSESTEQDQPETQSESATGESGPAETDREAPISSADIFEQLLALERARDPQGNIDTRPPGNETVTFRSVTVGEI